MKETANQIKKTPLDRMLMSAGARVINGNIAETPEREDYGRNDRSGIINTLQNLRKGNIDSV